MSTISKTSTKASARQRGDQVIRIITRRLEELVFPHQTLARLGGDEAIVLAEDVVDGDGAQALADRLKQAFQEPLHLNAHMIHVQASMGIVLYPRDGAHASDPVELLRRSDAAVRRAKRTGCNQWMFYRSQLIRDAANRVVVGGRLRKAMENGEIRVAYQPIVRLEDQAVIGYEALARWFHSTAPSLRTRYGPSAAIRAWRRTGWCSRSPSRHCLVWTRRRWPGSRKSAGRVWPWPSTISARATPH
jgi:diguanylate cyclase (GGDEF)-like protein